MTHAEWLNDIRGEAIKALTEKPVRTITAERVRLWSGISREVCDLGPEPLKTGLGVKMFLERVSVSVSPNDLLIGRETEELFSEEEEKHFWDTYLHEYMNGCGLPRFLTDIGHCSMRWNDLIHSGLTGLKKHAEEIRDAFESEGRIPERDFVQGAVHIYEGFIYFLERCAEAAEKTGLHEAAAACREAADVPKSFRAAMQLVWTVEFVYCAYISPNPTLTLGRLDLFLNDLYENDIRKGILTRGSASQIIDDFYAKNNLIMGRGEHQISASEDRTLVTGWHRILCFDAPQYLILSGIDPDTGSAVGNELTELFLERIEPRYKNPVIVFRYTRGFADEHPDIWRIVAERARASSSMMIYNDMAARRAYLDSGESVHDTDQLEYFGCNWPTLPARDMPYFGMWHSMGGSYLDSFMKGLRQYAGESDSYSVGDMISCICDNVRKDTAGYIASVPVVRNGPFTDRLQVYSCFAYDNIEKGGLYFQRINYVAPLGSIGTMIDILAAVDTLVGGGKISLKELLEACDRNFEGNAALRAMCIRAPKYGDGSDEAAFYTRLLAPRLADAAKEGMEALPGYCRRCLSVEGDTTHIKTGKRIGATPDGRLAGTAVSQNAQPAPGAAVNGLTAMLSSASQLPFERYFSGALNVSVTPRHFAGGDGLEDLADIMSAYLESGGLQLQISGVERETLLEAQKEPERYRDLMVRVTGYSAVFVDMCRRAQDDLIARDAF